MTSRSVSIQGKNYKLSGTLVVPVGVGNTTPAVVFYHGMVSKSKPRYVKRAEALAQKGIAALCFDFRGCGESDGKLGELSIADWLDDALLACDYLAKQDFVDKKRIGIDGKSFGGYMAALVSKQRNVKSMVLQAPAVFKDAWFSQPMQWTQEFRKERIAYRHTPEALNNKAISAIQQYNNPILIIGSEFDEMTPKPILEKYFAVCPSEKKELRWIKGADHSLTDEKYNQEYTQMMVDWSKETL